VSAPFRKLTAERAWCPAEARMEEFPTTMVAFEERFRTEEACVGYLREQRWPKGFVCPKCGGTKSWKVRGGRLDECAKCGRQVSVTAGTVFHGTRKPLKVWFRAMAMMVVSKQGCSAKELERLFGLHYKTAWTWGHKLRGLMGPSTGKLSGRVEVDESYLGGEDDAAHKGRSLEGHKSCVVAAVEDKGEHLGRARLETVNDATAPSLVGFVERHVEPGSELHTDGFGAYAGVSKKGYAHDREVVGHPKNAAKKFPHVHRLFSLLRRVLLTTYQGAVSPQHLPWYLDEFQFRFNRRSSKNRFGLVRTLLSRAFVLPCTYLQLVGKGLAARPLHPGCP
jgi:transposase-like protein